MAKRWWQSKTFWGAVAAVISAVGAYFSGEINQGSLLQVIATAVLSVCVRDGVSPIFGQPETNVGPGPK
jgi:hypothetical protein